MVKFLSVLTWTINPCFPKSRLLSYLCVLPWVAFSFQAGWALDGNRSKIYVTRNLSSICFWLSFSEKRIKQIKQQNILCVRLLWGSNWTLFLLSWNEIRSCCLLKIWIREIHTKDCKCIFVYTHVWSFLDTKINMELSLVCSFHYVLQ